MIAKAIRAALYIRVSTQEQTENYSIDAQTERLEAYCKAKGWVVYNTFVDGGYSGSNMDRPALQQMLTELPNIDAVVVYRLDRLSRSQRDTLTLIEDYFLKNKVDFVSVSETLDTSTPFGKAMIGILSVFAQLERETIAERMKMGLIKRAEEGLAIMGGDYDPAGYSREGGRLIIKEDEARHIQAVFNLYEQYLSITKIQKHFRETGEPVWRFRRYWDILRNKLYCGYVSFAGKYYKGIHEAIISEEQFERVQVLLDRHKGKNAAKASESLLSGLIHCGYCGESYVSYLSSKTLRTPKVYRYYICRAKRFPSEYDTKCKNHTWNQNTLCELVIDEIRQLKIKKEVVNQEPAAPNFTKLIKAIDTKISRVISLYAEGNIDKSILDTQISTFDTEKKALLKNMRDYEKRIIPTTDEIDAYVIDLEKGNFAERQAIIQKLVDTIVITGKSVEIEWSF